MRYLHRMTHDAVDKLQYFGEQYGRGTSEAYRRVERLALGHDLGGNGYTTRSEADRLAAVLELTPDSLLLDLGSGRGWPGSYLGALSGCRFVLTDLPMRPLRQARAYAEERGVLNQMTAIQADGIALPFGRESFEAISHADVLC